MTITLTNNNLAITDAWITEFTDDPTIELSLQITHNCGTINEEDITLLMVDEDDTINIELLDGVYFISLINKTDPEALLTKSICLFSLSEATRCILFDKYNNVDDKCFTELIELYTALNLINDCPECQCQKACTIYNEFINKLNNECCCS
jgi:hypothetical protein